MVPVFESIRYSPEFFGQSSASGSEVKQNLTVTSSIPIKFVPRNKVKVNWQLGRLKALLSHAHHGMLNDRPDSGDTKSAPFSESEAKVKVNPVELEGLESLTRLRPGPARPYRIPSSPGPAGPRSHRVPATSPGPSVVAAEHCQVSPRLLTPGITFHLGFLSQSNDSDAIVRFSQAPRRDHGMDSGILATRDLSAV
eukprot:768395-Hanusia_phi.AAC.3